MSLLSPIFWSLVLCLWVHLLHLEVCVCTIPMLPSVTTGDRKPIEALSRNEWLKIIDQMVLTDQNDHQMGTTDQTEHELHRLEVVSDEVTDSGKYLLVNELILLTRDWITHLTPVGKLLRPVRVHVRKEGDFFQSLTDYYKRLMEVSDQFWVTISLVNKTTTKDQLELCVQDLKFLTSLTKKIVEQMNLLLDCVSQARTELQPTKKKGCPTIWDGAFCWSSTLTKQIAKQSCGKLAKQHSLKKFAYKYCDSNGEWYHGYWNATSDTLHLECSDQLGWSESELKKKFTDYEKFGVQQLIQGLNETLLWMDDKKRNAELKYPPEAPFNQSELTAQEKVTFGQWFVLHDKTRDRSLLNYKKMRKSMQDKVNRALTSVNRDHSEQSQYFRKQIQLALRNLGVVLFHYTTHSIYQRRAKQCLQRFRTENRSTDGRHDWCPVLWDGETCWPQKTPASLTMMSCANATPNPINPNGVTYRYCRYDGMWLSQENWECIRTQYSYRGAIETLYKYQYQRISEHIPNIAIFRKYGYVISVFTILFVYILWFLFRLNESPWNNWNYIHLQLLFSFQLRALLCLIKSAIADAQRQSQPEDDESYITPLPALMDRLSAGVQSIDLLRVVKDEPNHLFLLKNTPVTSFCRVFSTVWQYTLATNYSWMLMEAVFMTMVLFSNHSRRVVVFSAVGWLLPIPILFIWAIVQHLNQNGCWDGNGSNKFDYIMVDFHFGSVIISSVLFVLVLVRLCWHIKWTPPQKRIQHDWFWPVLMMIPLFGVPYLLTHTLFQVSKQDKNSIQYLIWFYVETAYSCLQGFFVALALGCLWWHRRVRRSPSETSYSTNSVTVVKADLQSFSG